MLKKLLLVSLSALLLSLPWLGFGGWTLFFAFVPLLVLGRERPRGYWLWAALCFTLWSVATTWWVGQATSVASFGIPIVSLFFTLVPWMIFHWFRFRAPRPVAWAILVTAWIAFEKLFMENELSFPWLMLGNGFASNPWAVQWYEWTGSFGGSLWVLVGNVLCYYAWTRWREQRWRVVIPAAAWVVVPIAISLVRYATYRESGPTVKVAVIQPNVDPYADKFGGMTQLQQRNLVLDLARKAPADVRFIVTPETTLDDDFWLDGLATHRTVDTVRRFMAGYPRAEFILGATTCQLVKEGQKHERWTHQDAQWGLAYNVYNSALGIASGREPVELYHKSKLVVGVELFPYPKVLGLMRFLNIDLGGISGNLGMQQERTLFTTPGPEPVRTGVAICYEAIYGEFYAEYVRNGAQLMCIISNDGWWGDTPGHRQLFRYARLRAVETRRCVARAANTGISGFINQRGDVQQSLGWDQRGTLVDEVRLGEAQTLYVRMGDYIVRLALLVLGLGLLYYVAWRFRQKSNPS